MPQNLNVNVSLCQKADEKPAAPSEAQRIGLQVSESGKNRRGDNVDGSNLNPCVISYFFLSKMVLHEWCVRMLKRKPPAAVPLFPSGFYVYGQPAFLTLH